MAIGRSIRKYSEEEDFDYPVATKKSDFREGCKLTYTNSMGWKTTWTFENGKWVGRGDENKVVPMELKTLLGI